MAVIFELLLMKGNSDVFLCTYVLFVAVILCDPDRLCGLVVRVSGYRYRGLEFDSRRYQIF